MYVLPQFFVAAFYIVGDGLCVINGSVLRGCGLQVMAAKVVVFSYYIVAIPMSYYLGFHTDMGVVGLAWGCVCFPISAVLPAPHI